MHCKKCKAKDVALTITSSTYRKDGSRYIQYICRPCNSKKKRDERKRNPSYLNRATAIYRKKFPHKHNARLAARKNIELKPCQVCGNSQSVRHHPDYSKPLEVISLCYLHHKQVHLGVIPCPK